MKLSAYLIEANRMRTTGIASVKPESISTKTFTLKDAQCSNAKPGQFLMLWIPGVDEIPLSISDARFGQVSFAVKTVGEASRALHNMKSGNIVGIRGPFGNSFTENEGNVLMVGGGTGTAPLLFLASRLAARAKRLSFIIGAKTRNELLFLNELAPLCSEKNATVATEDGSYGLKCLATEPLERLLDEQTFDVIYTCGPELMVRKVFDLAEQHGIAVQASLERLVRCGIGLCGSCAIGKYRVCRDGPVFSSEQLREIKDEFGFSKLGFDGQRIPV